MTAAARVLTFGEYVVERELGAGAMGEVYLARDPVLERQVAIKRIASRAVSPAAKERFLVEARAAARIQHANVAAVYRAGEIDGSPFLVSEFVAGRSLDEFAFPLPYDRVLDIAVGLARGLSAAHERGVLHRDLKPSNVILTDDDQPKLVDFGLAKLLEQTEALPAPPAAPTAPTNRDATIAPDLRDATIAPNLRDATVAPTRRLTHEGALLGTPDYMAPEVWRAEPATPATDVYALGALLFELCTGHPPFASTPVEILKATVLGEDAPALATETVGLDRRFTTIVDRCLARDPTARLTSAERLAEALEQLSRDRRVGPVPEGNPYRGLAAFDARHRALFFGRERDVERIVDRLRTSALVVVTGDSGLGKSSLVRAGVVPRLAEGIDGRTWSSTRMTPGRHPLAALIAALDALVAIGEDTLRELVDERPHELTSKLRRKLGSERGLVLVVDQLEEFCTQSAPEERDRVAELLSRLADDVPGIRVLATLRADYLTRIAALPRLGEQLCRSIDVLGPLDADGIREVIVGPARATGLGFESEALVDELVEASDRRGALPLLQFALEQLWHLRDTTAKTIPHAALERLGGVAGALARHADDVLTALPAAHRRHARSLLVLLTNDEGLRVSRTAEELVSGDDEVARTATLDALVAGRLVVASELGDATVYELAHEVLITGWPTLVRWRHEDEDVRAARERLTVGVKEWIRLDRNSAALWSTTQLEEVAPLVERIDLSSDAVAFLSASHRRVRSQRRRRLTRLVGPPLFVALFVAGFFVYQRVLAERRADAALALGIQARGKAEAARSANDEARKEAFTAFDGGDDDAERRWSRATVLARRAERSYREALQHVERAIGHRPERDDLRAAFAELLYKRATLAELRGARELSTELLERLVLYDTDGALIARWRAPAEVELSGLPPDVQPTLERYTQDGERIVPTAIPLEDTPRRLRLPPGSYRLTVPHGDTPVRYPFVVTRGEHLVLDVGQSVPPLPDGFVFVPAGRFVYGSTADDESRVGFFDAVPAHAAALPAFGVARREVTFAEWLQFLDALPPASRDALLDSGMDDSGLTSGGLALTYDDEGWSVTMRPANVTYRARAGEPIRYPDRDRRERQDWLKMPVTGVSADDAQRYLAWLRETKRVPGARLCTEREWERAARGADRREYPHANVLTPDAINFDQTYAKAPGGMGPDEVGAHPASDSPFDLADTAGNAFEWTTAATSTATYVLRGGSFFYDAKTNRLTNRAVAVSSLRVASVGFRICTDLEKETSSK